MTDKQLKKLSRRELLELLILQTRKVENLEKQLEEANRQLRDRRILIESSGSLAEAAMKLNGVFEAAERAAQQYLENVRALAGEEAENGSEKN